VEKEKNASVNFTQLKLFHNFVIGKTF